MEVTNYCGDMEKRRDLAAGVDFQEKQVTINKISIHQGARTKTFCSRVHMRHSQNTANTSSGETQASTTPASTTPHACN